MCCVVMSSAVGNENAYTNTRLQGWVGDGDCYASGGIAGHAGEFHCCVCIFYTDESVYRQCKLTAVSLQVYSRLSRMWVDFCRQCLVVSWAKAAVPMTAAGEFFSSMQPLFDSSLPCRTVPRAAALSVGTQTLI